MANILHVEDNEMIRTLFRLQFQGSHTITSTANMTEAVNELAAGAFDLVIADYDLHVPGETGADLADDMKRKLDSTPMILLTGDHGMQPSFMLEHGTIKAIVFKPPNVADLKVTIDKVIADAAALRGSTSVTDPQLTQSTGQTLPLPE